MEDLKKEWEILHGDNEKYERYSLLIKLACILVTLSLIIFSANIILSLFIIAIFWGQEAIWKTFQERLCERILVLEKALGSDSQSLPQSFQFYSEWIKNKPSTSGVIKAYAKNALKPTVIYPYIILMLLPLIIASI